VRTGLFAIWRDDFAISRGSFDTLRNHFASQQSLFAMLQNDSDILQNPSATSGKRYLMLKLRSANRRRSFASLQNLFAILQNDFAILQSRSDILRSDGLGLQNLFAILQNGMEGVSHTGHDVFYFETKFPFMAAWRHLADFVADVAVDA
jgi:hypothetical protein